MKKLLLLLPLVAGFILTACVTIYVYFPAAAAEKAADRIIDQVWGEKKSEKSAPEEKTPPAPANKPEKINPIEPQSQATPAFYALLDFLVKPVAAAADFNISSPAIEVIKTRMASRHQELEQFYDNGAVGLTYDALITLRDPNAVSLRFRAKVEQAVNDENKDREWLYQEIAKANGHPEWLSDIRNTFAKRWIDKAKKGWWYQNNNGQWQKK
jgi:uncharacterized protein YdbL (DUF1318 family)